MLKTVLKGWMVNGTSMTFSDLVTVDGLVSATAVENAVYRQEMKALSISLCVWWG